MPIVECGLNRFGDQIRLDQELGKKDVFRETLPPCTLPRHPPGKLGTVLPPLRLGGI